MSDIEKVPVPGGNVNEPASGTQGDIAETDRLRQAFPGPIGAPGGPGGTPPPPVTVPGQGPGPRGENPEGAVRGIPGPILEPSDRPNTPVETPLAGPPGAGVPELTSDQDTMRVLSALLQVDDDEVQEWAQMVIDMILDA